MPELPASGLANTVTGFATRLSGLFALHALWHLVGAFGFVLLRAFDHARLDAGAELGAGARGAAAAR